MTSPDCICHDTSDTHYELTLALIREETTPEQIHACYGYPLACIEHWPIRFLDAARAAFTNQSTPQTASRQHRHSRTVNHQAQQELRHLVAVLERISRTASTAADAASANTKSGTGR